MTKTENTDTLDLARALGFATIAVHVEPELSASHRVEAAARLAREEGARLIGVGAEAIPPSVVTDPNTGQVVVEWLADAKAQVERRLHAAKAAFERDASDGNTEWTAFETFPSHALAHVADVADLLVLSPTSSAASTSRGADPAEVVMAAGRPVLLVPNEGRHLRAKGVVVAWKATREARRAIADSLPLLKRAEEVIVQAVCEADQMDAAAAETTAVAEALSRHGVPARADVRKAPAKDAAFELERVADLNGCDLIVAGAYGHSRLREWVFGGVTQHLLHKARHFVLLSH
ncbi:MAG: universal stress protein [Caulobacteraceae bacterium]